jgi:hypothetical protein
VAPASMFNIAEIAASGLAAAIRRERIVDALLGLQTADYAKRRLKIKDLAPRSQWLHLSPEPLRCILRRDFF